MGILRILFALAVVVVHTSPLLSLQHIAVFAVNSFFMISGFYMALILQEKYVGKNNSYMLFISNRFLRIFPIYWTILAAALILTITKYIVAPDANNYFIFLFKESSLESYPFITLFFTFLRNIFLIQPFDYVQNNYLHPGYLLIQPAWTLQLELVFYLFAPLFVRHKLLLIVSLLFFAYLTFLSGNTELQSNASISYLFLSRFIFFLFGILSYKIYKTYKKYITNTQVIRSLFILLIIFIFAFSNIAANPSLKITPESPIAFIYYGILILGIGVSFLASKFIKFDNFIGALSYPVYLSHQLVYKILLLSPLLDTHSQSTSILTVLITLFISILLVKVIESPINSFRQKRLKKR